MGKSREAHEPWEKRQLTSCPAMSCRKAEESTITFIYSWSQWVDLKWDLKWSSPLRRFWMDTLQGVNARRSHGISLGPAEPLVSIQHFSFGFPHRKGSNSLTQGQWLPPIMLFPVISSAGDGEGEAEPWQSPCWAFPIYFSQLPGDASAQTPPGGEELDPTKQKKRILSFSGIPASCLLTQEMGRLQVQEEEVGISQTTHWIKEDVRINFSHLCFVVPFLKVLTSLWRSAPSSSMHFFVHYNKAQKLQGKVKAGRAGRMMIRKRQIIWDESFSWCRNDWEVWGDSVESSAVSGHSVCPHEWHSMCVVRNPAPGGSESLGSPWCRAAVIPAGLHWAGLRVQPARTKQSLVFVSLAFSGGELGTVTFSFFTKALWEPGKKLMW